MSTTTPAGNIDISTGSHSSVDAGVGGAVGAVIALLLAMSALGVVLLVVWRRRNTSKSVLQSVPADETVAHLDNPVYGRELEDTCKYFTAAKNIGLFKPLCHCLSCNSLERR